MIKIKGTIISISKEIELKAGDVKPMQKKFVGLETADGQKLFLDLINKRIDLLKNINVGDYVEVEFTFKGNDTALGRIYNNLFCHSLVKL